MVNAREQHQKVLPLAERFWSIARARGGSGVEGDSVDPVKVVRHVLSVLDAVDRGESGTSVSVRTISFLKMLRESEHAGDMSYAAPEQISGQVLDERSLVFSVGVLLFERLTGRHPFGSEGNHGRRVARIRRGEFGSGVNYFPTVPSGLRSILMRAMGPFPEERWHSLTELRSHLEQFVEQESSNVVPLPGTTNTAAPRRRPAPTPHAPAHVPTQIPPPRPAARSTSSFESTTRVVDMTEQVRGELLAAAERMRRDSQEASGLIDAPAVPRRRETPPRVEIAPIALTPTPEPVPAPRPRRTHDRGAIQEADLLPKITQRTFEPTPSQTGQTRRTSSSAAKPVVWIGLGAALASVVFFGLNSIGGDDSESPATSSATPQPPAAQPADRSSEAQGVPPASKTAVSRAKRASAPATRNRTALAARAPVAPAPRSDEPAVFDAEQAGTYALSAALHCLPANVRQRGIGFGVGIKWDRAGQVNKVYFAGKHSNIPFKQRQCMQDEMLGAPPAKLAPERSQVIQYHARVRGDELVVTARSTK